MQIEVTDVQVQDVDPGDEAAFAQWFAVVDAVEQHSRPGEVESLAEDLRVLLHDGRTTDDGTAPALERRAALMLREGGRAVAAARVDMPLTDNRHVAFVTVAVRPEHRRRGHGSTLLGEAVVRAGKAGRSLLMTEIDEPPDLQGRSPGRAFAERHGFAPALEEVRRDLALPVDPAHLDAVEAACRQHAAGYLLRTWRHRCPDDLVDDRAELGRRMSTDAPMGELDWQEETWDVDRVRHLERLFAQQGRGYFGAGAVHEQTGRMVAYTEVIVPLARPERVHQWDTLVLREHRGRRLGTMVKLAMLRRLADEVPQARVISTTNAGSNAPMIAVNETLGFRVNGTLTSWQRRL